MAGALRALPTSLTKLFSLLRGALPGPIAAKPTASAVGTGEARIALDQNFAKCFPKFGGGGRKAQNFAKLGGVA